MQFVGIKELQRNPAILTKSLEAHEYSMITKRSKPIGLAVALDDEVIDLGLKKALLIEAYRNELLSLGQLASSLGIGRREAMRMLSLLGIDVVDYDFEEERSTLDELL